MSKSTDLKTLKILGWGSLASTKATNECAIARTNNFVQLGRRQFFFFQINKSKTKEILEETSCEQNVFCFCRLCR
jgi:hypothetical protein